ncbi:hypothetical protein ACLX1H_004755 [Fusarium chlamydosporum]
MDLRVTDIHIYCLGLYWLVQGFIALADPKSRFSAWGIRDTNPSDDDARTSFAPIYMLASRDISIGIFVIAHQHHDNLTAVLTLMAIMSFFKVGDAIVVFLAGDEGTAKKAIKEFGIGLALMGWLLYLAQN